MTRDAFIYKALRTARGKASPRGALAKTPPVQVLAKLQRALAEQVPCVASASEDVVIGCATQVDGQGQNIARTASLLAGWDGDVMGITVNRFCTSGLDAIALAAAKVASAQADLVVAGGIECVSQVPVFADRGPLYSDPDVMRQLGSVHMGIAADAIATQHDVDRAAADAYALSTRSKARQAWQSGAARASIAAIDGFDVDEYLAYAPIAEELAALPSAFAEMGDAGQDTIVQSRHKGLGRIAHVHTKATSPPPADGAALVVVGSADAGRHHGLTPQARIVATAHASCDPTMMLLAGQGAVEKLLQRAGLKAQNIVAFEFAEAFAAVCVVLQRALSIDEARLNPFGGTLAAGHALGATGGVLVSNLLLALEARQGRYGVAAIPGAAGVGTAMLIERV